MSVWYSDWKFTEIHKKGIILFRVTSKSKSKNKFRDPPSKWYTFVFKKMYIWIFNPNIKRTCQTGNQFHLASWAVTVIKSVYLRKQGPIIAGNTPIGTRTSSPSRAASFGVDLMRVRLLTFVVYKYRQYGLARLRLSLLAGVCSRLGFSKYQSNFDQLECP